MLFLRECRHISKIFLIRRLVEPGSIFKNLKSFYIGRNFQHLIFLYFTSELLKNWCLFTSTENADTSLRNCPATPSSARLSFLIPDMAKNSLKQIEIAIFYGRITLFIEYEIMTHTMLNDKLTLTIVIWLLYSLCLFFSVWFIWIDYGCAISSRFDVSVSLLLLSIFSILLKRVHKHYLLYNFVFA